MVPFHLGNLEGGVRKAQVKDHHTSTQMYCYDNVIARSEQLEQV